MTNVCSQGQAETSRLSDPRSDSSLTPLSQHEPVQTHWEDTQPARRLLTKSRLKRREVCFFLMDSFGFFLEQFAVYRKIEQKVQEFPYTAAALPPPIINIEHEWGTLVTVDVPILVHNYNPRFIADIRVHSRCCTFFFKKTIYCLLIRSMSFVYLWLC